MSPTDFGWLILLFPLLGSIVLALGWRFWRPDRRVARDRGDRRLVRLLDRGLHWRPLDLPVDERHPTSTLYSCRTSVGLEIDLNILVDPLAVVMC